MGQLESGITGAEEASRAGSSAVPVTIERGGCLTILLGGMIVGCSQVAVGNLYNVLAFLARVPTPTPWVVLAVGVVLGMVVAMAAQSAAYPRLLHPWELLAMAPLISVPYLFGELSAKVSWGKTAISLAEFPVVGLVWSPASLTVPLWVVLALGLAAGANVACTVGVWKWRLWGLIGLVATNSFALSVHLSLGTPFLGFVLGLFGPATLVILLRRKWDRMS
jgi:hypothetical protein